MIHNHENMLIITFYIFLHLINLKPQQRKLDYLN